MAASMTTATPHDMHCTAMTTIASGYSTDNSSSCTCYAPNNIAREFYRTNHCLFENYILPTLLFK
jgi:hypothetical protein